jgi:hypothetical protein
MKKTMIFVSLTILAFSVALVFADDAKPNLVLQNEKDSSDAALYIEIPDKDFPVPVLNGVPVPYDYVALPEEGYEVTSYVYTVLDSSFMQSYQEQLRKAGFIDQGKVMSVESFWRYDRKSDGLTLLVEMGHEESKFYISMYVNDLLN